MAQTSFVAAVDLGASGGRVMVGEIGAGRIGLREAHRFANRPVTVAGPVGTGPTDTELASTELTGTGLAGTGLAGTGLASTGLASTGLTGTELAGTELTGTGLAGTGLAGTGLAGTGLTGTELAGTGSAGTGLASTVHWDVLALYSEILAGLRAAGSAYPLASVGIDSWGVDYGLLDADGLLLGNPVHYRDARTTGVADRLVRKLGADRLYAVTGIASLPFNTLFQLVAAAGTTQLAVARTLLLMPDLLGYWLTGQLGAEVTNASTTQLLDVTTRRWATGIIDQAGIPARIFPPLREPGTTIGPLLPAALAESGRSAGLSLVAVGSHDTASAVVATPAAEGSFCYISCGTWSLVGLELDRPVLTRASRLASFTNEAGVDGTIRYLRNVMGLWLLQESIRTWAAAGLPADLDTLLGQAAAVQPLRAVVDPDDLVFLPPGDMPARIAAGCERTGQPVPDGQAEVVRCILDSLALAHWHAVEQAQQLSGQAVDAVHLVGGGSRNSLLCQLTADACGLPVLAGPAEATALGNVLIQARALGLAPADLRGLRELVLASVPVRRFNPAGQVSQWRAAGRRLGWN